MQLGEKRLIETAQAVAAQLKRHTGSTALTIRSPGAATETNTDGWAAGIGYLGAKALRLEIWLDYYPRCGQRNLSACFWSDELGQINEVKRHVSRKLMPVRGITDEDFEENGGNFVLRRRLPPSEFNAPILEKYEKESTYFFGIYDRSNGAPGIPRDRFCALAVAFFEDVARAQPNARAADPQGEIYPRSEDRKLVAAHLARERSGYLAQERKARDGYRCAICGMSFAERYGERLGADFAEAHHRIALKKQSDRVKTRIEDLITVCSNCHRMLHRMPGRTDDVLRLRRIFAAHRRRK